MVLSRFTLSLGWIVRALGLNDPPSAPVKFDIESVKAVLDVAGNGWGVAQYLAPIVVSRDNAAAETVRVIDPVPGFAHCVYLAEFEKVAGAVAKQVALEVAPATDGVGRRVGAAVASVGVDTRVGSNTLLAGGPIFIPEGYALNAVIPITVAGETVTVRAFAIRVPAGFKPH